MQADPRTAGPEAGIQGTLEPMAELLERLRTRGSMDPDILAILTRLQMETRNAASAAFARTLQKDSGALAEKLDALERRLERLERTAAKPGHGEG